MIMIYAYDQWAQMPTKDIYDTQMMAMAINAAKDMYDKGEKQLADFRKEYGDFYSPSEQHMNFYDQNFNVGGFVDQLRERGIDPLRSQEGRALVQQYINSRPYSSLQRMKKSAENYDEYLKNVAKAKANGTFNQDFEDFVLDGKNINDLGVNEIWDRLAPSAYQDLNQYTGHLFDKMDDAYIETDENGLDWFGVSRSRRDEALTPMLSDLLNTDLGKFHYAQSKATAELLNNRPVTDAEAMQQFRNDILTATHEYDKRTYKENPEYARRKEFEYAKRLDAARTANDIWKEKELRKDTPGFDSKGNGIPGYSKNKTTPNIFREAELRTNKIGKAGDYVQYEGSQQYYQHIDPVYQPDDIVIVKDKDSNETRQVYKYSNRSMKNMEMYKADSKGNLSRRYITHDNDKDYTFVPTGGMRARFVNGHYEYYISGRFVDGDGNAIEGSDGSGTTYLIPVKERLGNYGQTQKSK